MKYLVEDYQEGSETTTQGADTIREARQIARRKISIYDQDQGRKMRMLPHIIDAEREGYEAVETWIAKGGPNGDNETDFVTIFRAL